MTLACFTFGGWSLNGNAPALTNPYQVTGNTILKAIWVPNGNCILTFDANGGTGAVPGAISGPGPITLPGAGNLLKACSIFAGWSAVAGVGPALTSLSFIAPTSLFALWTPVTYSLTFNGNGNTGGVPVAIVGCGNVPLPGQGSMTNPGFTFGGWSSTSTGTVPLTSPFPLGVNGTLYAIWTPVNCTTTFSSNGGTGSVPISHVGCANFILPAPPQNMIKSCSNFQGWSLSGNPQPIPFFPAYSPPSGITILRAVWMSVTFQITYNKNGGIGNVPSPTIGCGTVQLKGNTGGPPILTKSGSTWKGWKIIGTNYPGGASYNLTVNVLAKARW